MYFCPNCGRELIEGKSCVCQEENYSQPLSEIISEPEDSKPLYKFHNSKLFAILAYIGILWILGLVVDPEKSDPIVKFHVGQGLVLFIAGIILNAVKSLVGLLGLNFLTSLLGIAIWSFTLALVIIGIINAYRGDEKELPIIGQFSFIK